MWSITQYTLLHVFKVTDVEDEGADWLAQVAERVHHAFEAMAVVGDGEVALDEVAERAGLSCSITISARSGKTMP